MKSTKLLFFKNSAQLKWDTYSKTKGVLAKLHKCGKRESRKLLEGKIEIQEKNTKISLDKHWNLERKKYKDFFR